MLQLLSLQLNWPTLRYLSTEPRGDFVDKLGRPLPLLLPTAKTYRNLLNGSSSPLYQTAVDYVGTDQCFDLLYFLFPSVVAIAILSNTRFSINEDHAHAQIGSLRENSSHFESGVKPNDSIQPSSAACFNSQHYVTNYKP